MKAAVSILLCSALLFLAFGKSVLVLDYQIHKKEIARTRCENRDRPELQCNGKCYLAKQLKKAEERENPAPDFSNLKELSPFVPVGTDFAMHATASVLHEIPAVFVDAAFVPACPGSVFHPPEA